MAAHAQEGWYLGGALGGVWQGDEPGFWQSPGPGDPRITYDVNADATFAGFISVGKTLTDGVRADFSLGIYGDQDIQANWVSPLPSTAGGKPNDHANIATSVSAISGMFNISVEPLALTGNASRIQPFVTAGIGFANVKMDSWTRTNLATINPPARPVRSFEGDDSTNFAWSIGGGVSIDLKETMNRPAYLDLAYRYSDFGNVSGGMTPLPGNGASQPIEPFNFDVTQHVVTVGLRFPIN
ncbi:MAG: porin family protein [Hoeflea sp.]|nr:porin family protein [Hoeflea sp.]